MMDNFIFDLKRYFSEEDWEKKLFWLLISMLAIFVTSALSNYRATDSFLIYDVDEYILYPIGVIFSSYIAYHLDCIW